MRHVDGDLRTVNNTSETITAAASAIAIAESRRDQATVQKRRWGSWWSIYWCFGSFKQHKKGIVHAILVPETSSPITDVPANRDQTRPHSILLPFVAPPSSPASFLQSDPSSATQSPTTFSLSSSMYSPGGPASIFAIGPYAYETQLVSPPVFSTFTTEASTAPYTPESAHLTTNTTPSSPEVPFARLLDSKPQNGDSGNRYYPFFHYEFQSYDQIYPGSPVCRLISPSSRMSCSGTSSPNLLNLDKLFTCDWGSQQGSGSLTPDIARSTSNVEIVINGSENEETERFSFDLNAGDVVRCEGKRSLELAQAVTASLKDAAKDIAGEHSSEIVNGYVGHKGHRSHDTSKKEAAVEEELQWHKRHRSITLGSAKDFNFDNADVSNIVEPSISSDQSENEVVISEKEGGPTRNWSFFPMMQPG